MILRNSLHAIGFALAGLTSAHATIVTLDVATYGQWQSFDVVDPALGLGNNDLNWIDFNDGSNLSYSFTIAQGQTGTLTVVDGGFSGDRFQVMANGVSLGQTSAALNSYPNSIGLDFGAALADPSFSSAVYTFGAGTYSVTGALSQSAVDEFGVPLNATVGAVQLNVSAVPLPAAFIPMLSGLLAGAAALRRRRFVA
ncbi:MAG: hypothetical protein AB9M60_23580 [Leptothrix sp. (in: b-proteobacteria)]